ncbi:hypothetical protein NDU88_001241 [Pleurodeles waltl]|uniref:Uncharacterized protein n=1 Tax=Pleurodeles waltl TaxID=8319 RepID=A0AAV7Q9J2_PLEWA|nr:hypothetical protein NDU88_001241 [Pleurodeles waltl]
MPTGKSPASAALIKLRGRFASRVSPSNVDNQRKHALAALSNGTGIPKSSGSLVRISRSSTIDQQQHVPAALSREGEILSSGLCVRYTEWQFRTVVVHQERHAPQEYLYVVTESLHVEAQVCHVKQRAPTLDTIFNFIFTGKLTVIGNNCLKKLTNMNY